MSVCFSVLRETSGRTYIPHHWRISPDVVGGGLWRPTIEMMRELRREIVPEFMRQTGADPDKGGFRMVVELERDRNREIIHLLAGDNVPATNPHDWRTPFFTGWRRGTAGETSFFSSCAEAAAARLHNNVKGVQMFYPEVHKGVFAVADGDPKAEFHRLVLAQDLFGTMVDEGFTAEMWLGFFGSAASMLRTMFPLKYVRYISNAGVGYQVGPRVHMHILASSMELPSQFPDDYGFIVRQDATIEAPAGSPGHGKVISLIDNRPKGFDPEVVAKRVDLDKTLMTELRSLRKAPRS